ncbi:TIGR03752 family integrating conjugative element protein [Variovorax sp. ZS18.2.2]|uniref:TIGR03752 family integrating conjugative element protein n=1 Tax=Variovorax sp. ZS18.2.2 TaxID=2971255 RepID=UPI002150721A|nr:TIGR03752 family integrating conjugative element protein [Variovorax sp. ZS18.2.2]MCR6480990.1 TIGR03752 family integrating conjugative element protein [Variovorax sp. ZS18.2.2]
MAVSSNRLIPILAVVVLAIAGTVLVKQCGGSSREKAGELLKQVPAALPGTKGADQDTPSETLKSVVASNTTLRDDVQKVLAENQKLRDEMDRDRRYGPRRRDEPGAATSTDSATGAGGSAKTAGSTAEQGGPVDVFGRAFDNATSTAGELISNLPPLGGTGRTASESRASDAASRSRSSPTDTTTSAGPVTGNVSYKLVPPMGYAAQTLPASGSDRRGVPVTRFVRTTAGTDGGDWGGGGGPASRAAEAAASARVEPKDVPYFTIPENGTLAGVTAMSSIIGRVPIDGRVTDPMQFKAIVGRDNLAANGWELPDDLAGMIVTGVAIGDMALSCSEGKVRSMTFVFNDGSVRTVSARRGALQANRAAGSSGADDLGFISDEHGNPCIPGKFVTNAASYLTDIVGAKSLGVAAAAFADAQRTTTATTSGAINSSVTGSAGKYALGQAASGATDELTQWLLQRLKNSFDAVVTPAGQRIVVHLDQEIRIDKMSNARKLVYRHQSAEQLARGGRYGLE